MLKNFCYESLYKKIAKKPILKSQFPVLQSLKQEVKDDKHRTNSGLNEIKKII